MIYYKPFSLEYQNDIKNLIIEAFGFHNGTSYKDEKLLATVYLWFCLSESSYGNIVIQENRAKGIFLGKITKKTLISSLKIYLNLYFYTFILFFKQIFSSKLRSNIKNILKFVKATKELYKDKSYQSQVILFVVSKDLRGQGSGRMLMEGFSNEIKKHNISNIFLFTDSTCSYQFYEKSGFIREGTASLSFEENPYELYLYSKQLLTKK